LLFTIDALDPDCVLGRAMKPPLKWKKPRTEEPPEATSPHTDRGRLAGFAATPTRRSSA
jgi:hypothetical protein